MNSRATVEAKLGAADEPGLPGSSASVPVPVADGYERWAPIYDRTPNPLLAREERYLLPLLADLGNKRILDLACGTGRWLERIMAPGGAWAVGMDGSAAMLRVAGEKPAIRGRLAQAACERLPFRTAIFDLAICSFALGHIQDLPSMVGEFARVMKPGGDVFISDLHPEAHARGWRVGFRDHSAAVQIEMLPRGEQEIVETFYANGFECLAHLPLCLGDPEKPIFVRAGKMHCFAAACQVPAVLVFHFRRLDPRRRSEAAMPTLKTGGSTGQAAAVRP